MNPYIWYWETVKHSPEGFSLLLIRHACATLIENAWIVWVYPLKFICLCLWWCICQLCSWKQIWQIICSVTLWSTTHTIDILLPNYHIQMRHEIREPLISQRKLRRYEDINMTISEYIQSLLHFFIMNILIYFCPGPCCDRHWHEDNNDI